MGQPGNKTALVTGATSGIGRASAQRFADKGAYVFVAGRQDELVGVQHSQGRVGVAGPG